MRKHKTDLALELFKKKEKSKGATQDQDLASDLLKHHGVQLPPVPVLTLEVGTQIPWPVPGKHQQALKKGFA